MSGSRATEGAWSPDAPMASLQDAILARPSTQERRMADAVRVLTIDAIEDVPPANETAMEQAVTMAPISVGVCVGPYIQARLG